MKKERLPYMIVALTAVVALLFSFSTAEKQSFVADKTQMIADWERAKAYTKEYLDAATEEAINSKPTAEMRTFGQQMLHLAEANYGLCAAATGKTSPVAWGALEKSEQHKTKATVTKAVMDSYDFMIAAIKEMDEQKMAETVKVFNFDMTRAVAVNKTFEHQTHHRGQTVVYLRLKGITPPPEKLF